MFGGQIGIVPVQSGRFKETRIFSGGGADDTLRYENKSEALPNVQSFGVR